MILGKRFEVPAIARRRFDHRLSYPIRTRNGWLISFQDHAEVIFLDDQLSILKRLDTGLPSDEFFGKNLAVSRDGRFVVLSTRNEIRVISGDDGKVLHRIAHSPWVSYAGGGCAFDQRGRLWCVSAGSDPGNNDLLRMVDLASGAILAEETIENPVGFSHLYCCPDGASMMIDIGCGQDGSYMYYATLEGTQLRIKQFEFYDRIFCEGFSPDGKEFVTGAHEGDSLKVHAFSSRRRYRCARLQLCICG